MNNSTLSSFYLERVGFESKVNFRHNLKNGDNIIGRMASAGVDIAINSLLCSRKHCLVQVNGDSILLVDLNSSNGTTVNGTRINSEKLEENCLIGIYGGSLPMKDLIGNPGFYVYRLRKYSTDNIRMYEIDDEDPIELSDCDEDPIQISDSEDDNNSIEDDPHISGNSGYF